MKPAAAADFSWRQEQYRVVPRMITPPFETLVDALVRQTQLQIVVSRASDGLIVYSNEPYARAQGYSQPEEIIGKTAAALSLWDSGSDREVWREEVLSSGQATRRFNFSRDGELGASILYTQLLHNEGEDYFVSYNFDISSVAQVEEQAMERLGRAQEIARIGDFTYTASTGLVTGSAQLGKILGFDAAAGFPTVSLLDRVHEDDYAGIRDMLNSDPDEYNERFRYYPDEDRSRVTWLEILGSVERDEQGNMVRWDGTIQDITERRLAEIEKDRLDEKMRDAQQLESLGLLAGGVAHDFNNLLVGVLGNADFALMDPTIKPSVRDRLKDIVTTAQRAADLTNQLLAYSGKGRFAIEATDLSELVREMSELLNVSVSKRCRLQLFLGDELPAAEVDKTQIRQVVMNLIMNASEAIEHGNGLISLKTESTHCSQDYLANAELDSEIDPGEFVVVEVSDNGRGMSESVRDRLFEPFFTTKFSGRGLGMSAVMGIVRGHGGAIKIYTEEGRGTSFKVFLPASQAEAVPAPAEDDSGTVAGTGVRVLVIDDDPLVSGLLERAMIAMGFAVTVAEDGAVGLEKFSADPDDIGLILLDLTMPNLDGVTTFSRMREIRPDVKAILMSGYNEQDATQEFIGKGLAGFLHKPFRIADLERVIRETL